MKEKKKSTRLRILSWSLVLCGLYFVFLPNKYTSSSFFDFFKGEPVEVEDSINLDAFSRIPVLRGGRVKPIDSVARNTLLVLRNKRTALDSNGTKIPAIKWLADLLFSPERADAHKTFLIDHDQVLGLIGKKLASDGKYFSYLELEPFVEEIEKSAQDASKLEREERNYFHQNIIELYHGLVLYRNLKTTLAPPPHAPSSAVHDHSRLSPLFYNAETDSGRSDEYKRFRKLTADLANNPDKVRMGNNEAMGPLMYFIDYYARYNLYAEFFPLPPELGESGGKWRKIGESLVGTEPLESKEKAKIDPARFISTVQALVASSDADLPDQIKSIRQNLKMDPSALFAAQYAEAIKLRKGIDPIIGNYEQLENAYQTGDAQTFNESVEKIRAEISKRAEADISTIAFEKTYNGYEPFYRSSIGYLWIFLIACVSWLISAYLKPGQAQSGAAKALLNCAYLLTGLVLIAHTFGLVGRMYIEGRPPVTNLYSSALFISWGAVVLCFLTEKFLRLGIASAMGSLIGFGGLVVAHNLSIDSSLNPSGDTMEMMRAVLDSNFWLATHVVTITIGYSTTFLAGFLGIAYVFSMLFRKLTRSKNKGKDLDRTLVSMIFGITCFSLFFSLVGTVLGGIWADQSWGRFWGWDAKENGALLIVIWNAIILHARWAGIAKVRGLSALAIFGNVVTAWSYFGTNMLGVGLHSYGFMDKAFVPLMAFIGSQLAIIGLAYLPALFSLFFKASPKTA
ncbi:cytochrome c biogenesis protein CcsA [Opitutales bacterium]|nr:cytochrome c biogenesis protein CcsA [Opitutales bacterium]